MHKLAVVALAVAGAAAAIVALLLVAALGLAGGRAGSDSGDTESATSDTSASNEMGVTTLVPVTRPTTTARADVELVAGATEFEPPPVFDGLNAGDTLVVSLRGFDGGATGSIAWCDTARCRDRFPVNFDGNGSALIQYRLEIDDTVCSGARSCRLEAEQDGVIATARIVAGTETGEADERPSVRIASASGVRTGSAVRVEASGIAQARMRVLGCARDAERRADCRLLSLRNGRVVVEKGVDRLVFIDRATQQPVVPPVDVATVGPRPTYDPIRLAAGLGIGTALLGAAFVLLRRTAWPEPAAVHVP